MFGVLLELSFFKSADKTTSVSQKNFAALLTQLNIMGTLKELITKTLLYLGSNAVMFFAIKYASVLLFSFILGNSNPWQSLWDMVISKTGTDFYFLHIWMTNLVININYFGLGFVFMIMDLTGLPKSLRKYKVILVFLTYKSKIASKEIKSLHKKSNKHFSDSTWNKWTSIMAKICGINLHNNNQPIFYWNSLFLCNLSVISCKIWLEWYKFGRCDN